MIIIYFLILFLLLQIILSDNKKDKEIKLFTNVIEIVDIFR